MLDSEEGVVIPQESNMEMSARFKLPSNSHKSQKRPSFDDLPLKSHHPLASAWGLWGDSDELGSLNLLTNDVTKSATAEIKMGRVVPLK